jgi:hypothetical protein
MTYKNNKGINMFEVKEFIDILDNIDENDFNIFDYIILHTTLENIITYFQNDDEDNNFKERIKSYSHYLKLINGNISYFGESPISIFHSIRNIAKSLNDSIDTYYFTFAISDLSKKMKEARKNKKTFYIPKKHHVSQNIVIFHQTEAIKKLLEKLKMFYSHLKTMADIRDNPEKHEKNIRLFLGVDKYAEMKNAKIYSPNPAEYHFIFEAHEKNDKYAKCNVEIFGFSYFDVWKSTERVSTEAPGLYRNILMQMHPAYFI